MPAPRSTRRGFLKQSSLAALAGATLPYTWVTRGANAFYAAGERPIVGCIGTGDRWREISPRILEFGNVAGVCDVDALNVRQAQDIALKAQDERAPDLRVPMTDDYRRILDRKDIEVVSIVTPDHWHSKIAIEALKAGKDVYCEKPLTLTIDEGKQIIKVLNATKRVFQVGTQQRSEFGNDEIPQFFLYAVALARSGRLGKIQKITCAIGGAPKSSSIPVAEPPPGFNWNMWQGQTPAVDFRIGKYGNNRRYREGRFHYEFRWFYEYSGGKLTDWGAHHIDIAQWAMGMENSGPTTVQGTAEHPVPFKDGFPTELDRYNAATKFNVTCMFPNGVELVIRDKHEDFENGILIEGTEARIFANRGKLTGKPVEDLKSNPLPEDLLVGLHKGKHPAGPKDKFPHMANFFECVKTRETPISDVHTHHRAMTTCHLANIAIRLDRKIEWNPETEQIVGDKLAQSFQAREQRKGFEIVV